MKKKKAFKIVGLFLIILGILIPVISFSRNKLNENREERLLAQKINNNENYFAIIDIPKIKLKKELYEINNIENDVNKNILVHKNSTFPNNIILASHSGNKSNAYFKNLYKLQLKDVVHIYFQNKLYEYIIEEIEDQDKTGNLYIKEEFEERLILITCSKNNNKTQTLYYAKLKSIRDI